MVYFPLSRIHNLFVLVVSRVQNKPGAYPVVTLFLKSFQIVIAFNTQNY